MSVSISVICANFTDSFNHVGLIIHLVTITHNDKAVFSTQSDRSSTAMSSSTGQETHKSRLQLSQYEYTYPSFTEQLVASSC